MTELLRPFERISLPVEPDVWEMFDGFLRDHHMVPKNILSVGDDGDGTLPALMKASYPDSRIHVIDRNKTIIARLDEDNTKRKWSLFHGDITDSGTQAVFSHLLPDGFDVVFFKHDMHMNGWTEQEEIVASLFRVCRIDGAVGWSIPTLTRGIVVKNQSDFVDRVTIKGLFGSTVFAGKNTSRRFHLAETTV